MMNTKLRIIAMIAIVLMLAVILLPVVRPAQASADLGRQTQTPSYDALDAYIEGQMKALNVPGASLVVVEGDQIVHTKGFGTTGPGGSTPTPQTPFFIGSLTKSFTSLAVMQLVEEGKVDLDAPIQQYLPWFTLADADAASRITVRQLMIQTSGISQIPGMIGLANFDDSADEGERQVRGLSDSIPSHQPGETWEYSNVNFNLLGLIVETVSGESYSEYVQNHIFTPLDMQHSYTSKEEAQQDGLITGNQQWFGFPVAVPDQRVPVASLPSGQLIASAEDMAHYLIAQLNQGEMQGVSVLSGEGMDLMHQPAASVSLGDGAMGYYGMGWFVNEIKGQNIVYHYGEVPDFFAYMALLPDQDRAIVLLFNTNEQLYTYALLSASEAAALSLAGVAPEANNWPVMPWALRAALLLPVLQVVLIAVSARRLKTKRMASFRRPVRTRVWVLQLALPILLNLILVAIPVAVMASGLFKFLMLFMGDLLSIFVLMGIIALIWIVVRTTMIVREYQSS